MTPLPIWTKSAEARALIARLIANPPKHELVPEHDWAVYHVKRRYVGETMDELRAIYGHALNDTLNAGDALLAQGIEHDTAYASFLEICRGLDPDDLMTALYDEEADAVGDPLAKVAA